MLSGELCPVFEVHSGSRVVYVLHYLCDAERIMSLVLVLCQLHVVSQVMCNVLCVAIAGIVRFVWNYCEIRSEPCVHRFVPIV